MKIGKFFATILVLALMLSALPAQFAGAASPGDIVINEIMQNPAAVADSAGEWLELYNASEIDVDVNGWTIADNDVDSHVINNGGPLVIPAGGYLVLGNNTDTGTNGGVTVAYSYGGSWFLANGADEVVLFDDSLVEIDRVEYDGGPNFPDPTGASMALSNPALDNNVGANWCEASTTYGDGDLGTPGAANDCPVSSPQIVVNEIMQNPAVVADSAGEWFELYNAGSSEVDINGWTIADNDTDSHVISNGGPLLVPAGGYLVLGNNTDTGTNGGVIVDYSYGGSWFLANGADEVVLFDGGSNEIDRVEYDDGATFPDPNGASMALSDPALDNNDGANWCTSTTSFGAGDLGTPGAANDCGATSVFEVVINEIMQNPNAVFDSDGEWFELYNAGNTDVDVNGWTIADNDSDSHVINNGGPLLIPAGGYLVLGNNTDTATNGGATVSYNYGSSWFLSNGADEVVLLDNGLNEVDRVEYDGGPNFPDPTGASMSLSEPALDNNNGANWCTSTTSFGAGDLGTPGTENNCTPVVEVVKIHEVQGNTDTSPLAGSTVVIEGIVVGDFQHDDMGGPDGLDGFFVQEEDVDVDSDPLTSEGVFVYNGNFPAVEVAMGDLVQVEGQVSEFSGLTEITSFSGVTIISSGNPLPTASNLSLPVTGIDDFEAYESMYVTFPQALYISEYFNFDRFGEIVLTSERQFQPTAVYEPGSPEAADLADANTLGRITLDDGRTSQNPDPAIHPNGMEFTLSNRFRGGDTVANVTGVMHYAFGLYRVQPTEGADYSSENPRADEPENVGGNLKVASFNVLNYFTTLDYPTGDPLDNMCGPLQNQECRGADANQPLEFTRQRDKIIAAITAIDADVVGLIEIENHPGDVPTADLVSGLNDVMGAGTYDYIATGAIGTDAIRQAFIYKPASVTPVGGYAVLDDASFTDPLGYGEEKSRPALAQTFANNETGGVFTAVVNHLKSKGSSCGDGDDDPEAGSCNLTRALGAQALVDWLATDPTGIGDGDYLIIGDLNAYDKEDPIDVLIAGGFADLVNQYQGEYAYSYVFDGQLGYLDHALGNADMSDEVTGVTIWHINADEPDLIDYDTSFKQDAQDAIYAPDAYRSSDHDPVIVGLELTTEQQINELIAMVQALVDDGALNDGQGNALISKLENALDKLARGNTNATANQLGAFINQVEDFIYEGVLTAEQGNPLIKVANALVNALSD